MAGLIKNSMLEMVEGGGGRVEPDTGRYLLKVVSHVIYRIVILSFTVGTISLGQRYQYTDNTRGIMLILSYCS